MRNAQQLFFRIMRATILSIAVASVLYAGNQAIAEDHSPTNPDDSEVVYLPIVAGSWLFHDWCISVYLEPKADMIGEVDSGSNCWSGSRHRHLPLLHILGIGAISPSIDSW